jgi:hypothetical protein
LGRLFSFSINFVFTLNQAACIGTCFGMTKQDVARHWTKQSDASPISTGTHVGDGCKQSQARAKRIMRDGVGEPGGYLAQGQRRRIRRARGKRI